MHNLTYLPQYLIIDRFPQWRLTAKMNPSSNMVQGAGCLVHHPSKDNEEKEGEEEVKHYALVTQTWLHK